MYKAAITAILMCFTSLLLAQSDSKPFIKMHSFQISNGFEFQSYNSAISFDEFKAFSSDASLFSRDLTGFESNNYHYSYLNSNFEANVGFYFRNKDKDYNPKRELQIGIGFGQFSGNSFYFHRSESHRIDTLISSATNQMYFQDSIRNFSQSYSQNADLIYLNLKYLFKTNTKKRFYAYAGIGLKFGFSINSTIDSYYHEHSSLNFDPYTLYTYDSYYHGSYYMHDYISEHDSKKGEAVFTASTQLKLGVNFRISNKHDFWKHWNVYLENGIGIDYIQIGAKSMGASIGNNTQIGLRYTIN